LVKKYFTFSPVTQGMIRGEGVNLIGDFTELKLKDMFFGFVFKLKIFGTWR